MKKAIVPAQIVPKPETNARSAAATESLRRSEVNQASDLLKGVILKHYVG
jgi:hypothetical protein